MYSEQGGWDSTYRVLALASDGRMIRPHYVRIPKPSWEIELKTIESIRRRANRRFGERILPVQIRAHDRIRVPDQVQAWGRALNERFGVGAQYMVLSEYSLNETGGRLELCVHVDDKAQKAISWAKSHKNDEGAAVLLDAVEGLLLSRFRFPILELSKLGMQRRAKDAGFEDLLDSTWFCHQPTFDGRPCGFCGPCSYTLKEGLGHRIPADRRVRYQLWLWLGQHLPTLRLRQSFKRRVRGKTLGDR